MDYDTEENADANSDSDVRNLVVHMPTIYWLIFITEMMDKKATYAATVANRLLDDHRILIILDG